MSAVAIHHRRGIPALVPDAFVLVPRVSDGKPPVVAVHGIQREAAQMAQLLVSAAEATGRTVILPHFDRRPWRWFQRAACPARADWALIRLLTALQVEGMVAEGPCDLSGYSGGGQFAHRFAWLYPHLVRRLCATAPGWWTFADPNAAYPYGVQAESSPFAAYLNANLRAFLNREIVVRVGALDTQRDGKLRVSPELDRQQGLNRVERAERWVQHIQDLRTVHNVSIPADFRILPNCTHSFSDCVAQAGLDRDFVVASPRDGAASFQAQSNKEVA